MKHTCHWLGCTQEVPAMMWGCKTHWFCLPAAIRNRIMDAYNVGQEITKRVSAEYLAAAREAQDWIHAHGNQRK